MVSITKFIEERVNLARQLYEGKCGAKYSDAVIILVSVISAVASKIWPGRNKDKKRFIEAMIQYSPNELNASLISIPLLIQHLEKNDKKEYDKIKSTSYQYGNTRVFQGSEIDKTEQIIIELCPSLELKQIRKFSYANILYEEVRSGLVHEYKLGDNVASNPMHDYSTEVSYTNNLSFGKLLKSGEFKLYHNIYFHFEWIELIINSMKDSLRPLWNYLPLREPDIWWIDVENK